MPRPLPTRAIALPAALLLFALATLPVAVRLAQAPSDQAPADLLMPVWLSACLWAAVAALAGRMRRWLWLLLVTAWLGPWEAFYIARFHLDSGPHLYGVVADTDWVEASSWLGPWALPLALAIATQLLVVGWLARQLWRADWRWTHRSRWWVLAAAATLAVLFAAGEVLVAQATAAQELARQNSYLQHSLSEPAEGARAQLEGLFPWGLPLRLARFAEHRQALASHLAAVQSFDFQPRWRSPPAEQRVVHILVIGETARADRWSLFGAERATTPQLVARHERGELAAFADAASPAAATRESVPLMLTRRPPGAALQHTAEPSLVWAFRQAGFRTYWLSTQGAAGRHETPISVLARESHEQHFINNAEYKANGAQDGELLPLLADVLARPEPRQFIVLHTLGSHLNYAHRYPPSFARFQPALSPNEKADIWQRGQAEPLRNAYDNSVLYTDDVLERAIALLAQAGAVATLTYAADHGESLFDGGCQQAGHGFSAAVNYHVPFFVWSSPAWRERHEAQWQRLLERQQQPISTLATFSTVLDLAGLDIAQVSGYPGLAAGAWQQGKRPVTHFGDYDTGVRVRGCDVAASAPRR